MQPAHTTYDLHTSNIKNLPEIFQQKSHLLVNSEKCHLKDICVHYINQQSLKFSHVWFSRCWII